ncbi:TolC family protein [Tautonia sociabilis]|uniref:TolC family protein n=1 Tax=Tautonia sociabilis TaxID=2080755 RepID=UPI0013154BDA|nr:TolC family protein [Tautonia sociabilis]
MTALSGEAFARDRTLLAQATSDAPPGGQMSTADAKATAKPRGSKAKAEAVTLDEAILRGLARSPRLKASQAAEAASRGERRQAGALLNPEVSFSKENFRAGKAYKVISPAQNVYGVSQRVEVGGKIASRERIAEEGVQIASLETRATALDLIRDITIAYAEAVAAEENVRLSAEQKELADDVLKSVSMRVEAAASPQIQRSRAEVERSAAAVALDGAKREREIARRALATLMGQVEADFKLDNKAFFTLSKPDAPEDPEGLKGNPDVLKLNPALEQSRARLELERANAIPDPLLSAGVIEIPSARDKAFVVGVSLPLPVFNANRGNIERARGELSRTEQENRRVALSLDADLARAGQQLENAYVQANTLKSRIIPSAQEAFSLAREGYGLGRFPYLEVLDAQRSLFAVKQQHIAALRQYHTARAVVERLTASHADDAANMLARSD